MKKLLPVKQAEMLKWLFRNPLSEVVKQEKPSKRKKRIFAWYYGADEINEKSLESLEEKGYIVPRNQGYVLTRDGQALAEMLTSQRVYDFKNKEFRQVTRYDIDPLHVPNAAPEV